MSTPKPMFRTIAATESSSEFLIELNDSLEVSASLKWSSVIAPGSRWRTTTRAPRAR